MTPCPNTDADVVCMINNTRKRVIFHVRNHMAPAASQPPLAKAAHLYDLVPLEKLWADKFELLKSHGYLLRPRYRPGWAPPDDPYAEDAIIVSVCICKTGGAIAAHSLTSYRA